MPNLPASLPLLSRAFFGSPVVRALGLWGLGVAAACGSAPAGGDASNGVTFGINLDGPGPQSGSTSGTTTNAQPTGASASVGATPTPAAPQIAAQAAQHAFGSSIQVSTTGAAATDPSLTLDAQGHPLLAWLDSTSGSPQVYVAHFDGNSWMQLSGSASGGGVSAGAAGVGPPALALDGNNQPCVAWPQSNGVMLTCYSAASNTWNPLGSSATAPGVMASNASAPTSVSLLRNAQGNLTVIYGALEATSKVTQIFDAAYVNNAWTVLGGTAMLPPPQTGVASASPTASLGGDGNLYVTFAAANHAFAIRLAGSTWQGNGTPTGTQASLPAVAVNKGGTLYLGLEDSGGGTAAAFVQTFHTSLNAWSGVDSAFSNGQVSSTSAAHRPRLALDSSGYPAAVWEDTSSGQSAIYMRHFNSGNSTWAEVASSASNAGVSQSKVDASHGRLALDSTGHAVVAWQAGGAVYVAAWY